MPRVLAQEFERLPLRVRGFPAGVPLHDVWAIDLPRPRAGITFADFVRAAGGRPFRPSRVVRPGSSSAGSSAGIGSRTSGEDDLRHPLDGRRSLAVAGAGGRARGPSGSCTAWEGEALLEVLDRTAHTAALSALVETADAYQFYFAVYVRRVGRLTPVYMALIDPFRKLVVYPRRLRSVRASWTRTFGPT